MKQLGSGDGVYLGDGEWLSWDEFGAERDFDVDEERCARLPVLEWEADMELCYPRAELGVIRQFIRLSRATVEFWETSGRRLPVYGVLGELYASMMWGVSLHKTHNAAGFGREDRKRLHRSEDNRAVLHGRPGRGQVIGELQQAARCQDRATDGRQRLACPKPSGRSPRPDASQIRSRRDFMVARLQDRGTRA
jgi:hypothetical protein